MYILAMGSISIPFFLRLAFFVLNDEVISLSWLLSFSGKYFKRSLALILMIKLAK